MAAPAFKAVSNAAGHAATTGTLSVSWPTHATNDIALLFIERAGGSASTSLSTPAGFTQIGVDQSTGTTTAGTKIGVYWCRATSSAMSAPTIAASADHQFAVMITFSGCITTGNPFSASAGGVKATASASATVSGVTTNRAESLIVSAIAIDLDSASAFASAQTNAALTSITERFDAGTTSGLGGGIAVWDGQKAASGFTGTTAVTVTSSINAFFTVALVPPAPTFTQATYRFYEDGTESGSVAIDAQDTNITRAVNTDSNLQLRTRIQETAGALAEPTDDYRLQYQINSNGFWTSVAPSFTGYSDPDTEWSSPANLFDGNIATTASTLFSFDGSSIRGYILGSGTTAPTSGGTITQVRTRNHSGGTNGLSGVIYTKGIKESLGAIIVSSNGPSTYSNYTTLTAPVAGWSWQTLHDLQFKCWGTAADGGFVRIIEIEVTHSGGTVTTYYFDGSGTNPLPVTGYNSTSLPPTSATDDFNRTNANPIAGNWTTIPTTAAMQLSANTIKPASLGTDSGAYYNAGTFAADQFAQAQITVTGTGGGGLGMGLALRCSVGAATYYRLVIDHAVSNNIELAKFVAGAYTRIWIRTVSFIDGDTLRLEAEGTTLRAYLNGVQVGADATDSAISTGRPGIAYSASEALASADNWAAGDWSTTNRLGAGTGSFVAGEIAEDGLVDDNQITASNYTEYLYSMTLISAALSDTDTLDFRVARNGLTTGLTYTVTPRITVSKTTGSIITKTQTAIARISSAVTKTQGALARISKGLTKTQSAAARIAITATKTQTAIARVSKALILTQGALARVTNSVTRNQTATSRIQKGLTLTQSAISRVAIAATKTQTAVSRISKALTKTQSAIANIASPASLTKTQTSIARISKAITLTQGAIARISTALTKTQSATARISRSFTKTQAAIARVSKSFTFTQAAIARISVLSAKSQNAVARITATVTRTQLARAAIQNAAIKTQSAIARISKSFTFTQSAVARISISNTKAQTAIARISVAFTKTQLARAAIQNSVTKTQSATARVSKALTKTQGALARISKAITLTQGAIANIVIAGVTTKTQTATARINNAVTKTQAALARIQKSFTFTQSAIARISIAGTKTQTAIARLSKGLTFTQTSLARIQKSFTKTQSAVARISVISVTKTQTATARISKALSKTQSSIARVTRGLTFTQAAISRIAKSFNLTQGALARISKTVTKTQTAIANIAVTGGVTKTQTAVARIQAAVTKTQSALARIQKSFTLTQPSTARVAASLTKTQSAAARITKALTKTQTAIANIVSATVSTKTQTAVARIANTATKTQTAVARISKSFTLTQTAIAKVQKVFTKTQTATGRIRSSLTLVQQSTARITKPLTLTQGAVSRIAKSFTLVQSAAARVRQSYSLNQSALARMLRANNTKTQLAVARIVAPILVVPDDASIIMSSNPSNIGLDGNNNRVGLSLQQTVVDLANDRQSIILS